MAMIECFRAKGWGYTFSENGLCTTQSIHNTTIQNMTLNSALLKDCNLTGVRLQNCKVESSTLDNCQLVNSRIKGSTLKDSKMNQCTSSNETKVNGTCMEKCIIYDSTLESCEVDDSVFFDSRASCTVLSGCRADTVQLLDSICSDSKLRFCQFSGLNTSLSTSLITDCQMSKIDSLTVIKDCQMSSHPVTLRKFPPEIRNMIFKNVIGGEGGRKSSLIAALRGEPRLYYEALHILNKICVFRADNDVVWAPSSNQRHMLQRSNPNILKHVRHISIDAHLYVFQRAKPLSIKNFGALESVHFDLHHSRLNVELFVFCRHLFLAHTKSMACLAITFYQALNTTMVRELSKVLGLQGQKTLSFKGVLAGRNTWMWEAESGKKLGWDNRVTDSEFKKRLKKR